MIEKKPLYISTVTVLIFFYVISGLAAMVLLSPQIPYADSWRFLAQLLELPFPQNILMSDNGHREVIPNLIRLVDLHWFSAAQSFQIFCGVTFALITLGIFLKTICASQLGTTKKSAVILFSVMGIFWLGNIRVLGHASEAIHAYLITACLIQGIVLLTKDINESTRSFINGCYAGALGFIASFSFGSGIACFAAFFVVLAIQKSRWQIWVGVTLWLLFVIAINVFSSSTEKFIFSPYSQLNTLLSWISAPIVYAAWPFLDPAIAAQIPIKIIQEFFIGVSTLVEGAIGPVVLGPWPFKLISLTALLLLLRETWLLRSSHPAIPMLGVAMSWFAVVVGGLIAIGRYKYFFDYPEQVLAARYIVWSSWFWVGLGIAIISRKTGTSTPLVMGLSICLILLPSQIWMTKLGVSTKNASEFGALAVTLEAYNSNTQLGENIPAEILHILPELKNRKAGIFLWPEINLLNANASGKKLSNINATLIKSENVINFSGDEWQELTVACKNCSSKNLLVLDQNYQVVGLVRKKFFNKFWIGWAKVSAINDQISFAIIE